MGQKPEAQTQKVVVMNASVFLAVVLLDEPPEIWRPATALFADIMAGKVQAHIPDRFEDEVLGGLVEAISKGRPIAAKPFEALKDLMANMTIHYRITDWQSEEVFNAALRWRVSYYDAVYLLVAQKLGATYWTADKKLLRFLQRQRFTDLPNLDWIGNYLS
ncbi:MAG: type II toxin-antitoxin system VapC family toxin [Armatimonadetes bacterium]|nr:type II toxin-antitoxin system VapC family toxin [Armatimonadota bacterium]